MPKRTDIYGNEYEVTDEENARLDEVSREYDDGYQLAGHWLMETNLGFPAIVAEFEPTDGFDDGSVFTYQTPPFAGRNCTYDDMPGNKWQLLRPGDIVNWPAGGRYIVRDDCLEYEKGA